ncbi:MAG: hypothetical protein R2736_10950 [Solirubrobacterales bacterium]
MRRLAVGAAAAGLLALGAAGGAVAAGALGDDELEVQSITVPAPRDADALIAEDGIPAAQARRLAAAATRALPGTPISVERDDGLYAIDVRDRSGAIVEVLADDAGRVVGMDRGDD